MLNRPDIDQLNSEFSGANQCQKWASSLRYMDEIQARPISFSKDENLILVGGQAATN